MAAALKPLAQLFWRQGDAETAVALQRYACSVLDADAAHALSGELPISSGSACSCVVNLCCAGNLQDRSQLVRMLIAAQLWSAAVPAAAQLLQRSQLQQDSSPQPPPDVCYELLAQVMCELVSLLEACEGGLTPGVRCRLWRGRGSQSRRATSASSASTTCRSAKAALLLLRHECLRARCGMQDQEDTGSVTLQAAQKRLRRLGLEFA